MKRKKILFIINSLKCGGAEKMLKDIFNNIDLSKYELYLLVFNKHRINLKDFPTGIHFIQTLKFGCRINHYFELLLKHMGLVDSYYMYKIQKAVPFKFDTIVSFLEGFPVRAHCYLLDKAENHVSFIHTDLSSYKASSYQFEDEDGKRQADAYQLMDKLVFVSHNIKDAFIRVYPQVTTQKEVLVNFIDTNKIRSLSCEGDFEWKEFTVVSVGRIVPIKGFDLLLDIAQKVKESSLNIKIRVVGDGSERVKLQRELDRRKLSDILIFEGFSSNPYPYMRSADVFISTSLAEGLPLAMAEAMSLSKPIISTKTAGAVELLGDGSGILVDRNADLFFMNICDLLNSEQLRVKYAKKSFEKSKMFDKNQYMKQLYKII